MLTLLIVTAFAVLLLIPLILFNRLRELSETVQHLQARLIHLERNATAQAPQPSTPPISSAPVSGSLPIVNPITPAATASNEPTAIAAPPPIPSNQPAPIDQLLARGRETPAHSTPIASDVPPPIPQAAVSTPVEAPPVPTGQPRPISPSLANSGSVTAVSRKAPVFNWEQFLGVKLFAWLGGFALFLGAVLFIKLSIEEGWISPAIRIGGGYALGVALVTTGLILQGKRYAVLAQTLCATGVVTLYGMTYSAWTYYGFFGPTVTFALMGAITIGAFGLALHLRARVVAILGLLGGFLTPILVNTGHSDAEALFTYIGFLDTGLIAVAIGSGWGFLMPLAAVGTVAMEAAWGIRFFDRGIAETMVFVAGAFDLLFALGAAVARKMRKLTPAFTLPVMIPVLYSYVIAGILAADLHSGLSPQVWLEFVFWSDLCALSVLAVGEKDFPINGVSGAIAFGLLTFWTGARLDVHLLPWALASYVGYAVLHGLTPLAFHRARPAFWATVLPFVLLAVAATNALSASPDPFFGTALILALFAGAASFIWNADTMPLWALFGVGSVAEVWQNINFHRLDLAPPFRWYIGFYFLFTAYPFLAYKRFRGRRLPWLTSALAGPVFFWLIYSLLTRAWPDERPGWLPAAFAILPALMAWIVTRFENEPSPLRLEKIALFTGASACFVALVFPIQLQSEWITSGWALEGVALLWLFRRLPHRGLAGLAVVLLLLASAKLIFTPLLIETPVYATREMFDRYLFTYGLAAAALLVSAQLVRKSELRWPAFDAVVTLSCLAGILIFLLINLEIADYFDQGYPLRFALTGDFARQMTVTVAWALYALVLLLIGIWKKARGCRYAAVGLLVATLVKLFFFDLAQLSRIYLIGALVGVALVALISSFLYQRFVPANSDDKAPDAPPPLP